jgi:hypothetical protein
MNVPSKLSTMASSSPVALNSMSLIILLFSQGPGDPEGGSGAQSHPIFSHYTKHKLLDEEMKKDVANTF